MTEPNKNYVNTVSAVVNHPPHYTKGKIEVIEAIEDWKLSFHLSNAIKYIARSAHKGKEREDLEKAIWYIKRHLEVYKDE